MSVATSVLTLLWLAADTGAPAAAVEPGTTVSLEVRAAPDCTSRADLLARIARRSPRIRAVDGAAGVEIRATFSAAASGSVVAELQLAEVGEPPSSRRLIARSCAEAANGVALIIAVTLDPTAALEGAAPAREPPSRSMARASGAPEAAVASHATSGPAAEARPPTAEASTPAPPDRPRAEEVVVVVQPAATPSPPPPASSRYGLGLAGQTLSGPAPAVMPGVAVYALAAFDRPSPWSPALAVGIMHVWRAGLDEPGGSASFTADALGLDLCGLRLHGWVFELRACASALVGRLSARGSETYAAASATRWLGSAGLASVLAARLGDHVELVGRLGMGAALVRDRFEFAPNVFHRTGALTVSASLGLGVRLP